MEPDQVGLPSVYVEAVYQEIVVENVRSAYRRRNLYVEQVYEVVVEVGADVHVAGELGECRLVLNSGDAAGVYHLLALGRVFLPVEHGVVLGDHYRQIRLS